MEQSEELSSEIRSGQPFAHVQKDVAKSSPEAGKIHITKLQKDGGAFMYLGRK